MIERAGYIQKSAGKVATITWQLSVVTAALGGPPSYDSDAPALSLFLQVAESAAQRRNWKFNIEVDENLAPPATEVALSMACAARWLANERGVRAVYHRKSASQAPCLEVEGAQPGAEFDAIAQYLAEEVSIGVQVDDGRGIVTFTELRER
jgi:hypothetical protein